MSYSRFWVVTGDLWLQMVSMTFQGNSVKSQVEENVSLERVAEAV